MSAGIPIIVTFWPFIPSGWCWNLCWSAYFGFYFIVICPCVNLSIGVFPSTGTASIWIKAIYTTTYLLKSSIYSAKSSLKSYYHHQVISNQHIPLYMTAFWYRHDNSLYHQWLTWLVLSLLYTYIYSLLQHSICFSDNCYQYNLHLFSPIISWQLLIKQYNFVVVILHSTISGDSCGRTNHTDGWNGSMPVELGCSW